MTCTFAAAHFNHHDICIGYILISTCIKALGWNMCINLNAMAMVENELDFNYLVDLSFFSSKNTNAIIIKNNTFQIICHIFELLLNFPIISKFHWKNWNLVTILALLQSKVAYAYHTNILPIILFRLDFAALKSFSIWIHLLNNSNIFCAPTKFRLIWCHSLITYKEYNKGDLFCFVTCINYT